MTSRSNRGFLHDDAKLHTLCHEGNLEKVKEFVKKLDLEMLKEKLAEQKRRIRLHTSS